MIIRLSLNLLLGISLLAFPWWMSLLLMLGMAFIYSAYEILFWGLAADALYGWPLPLFDNTPILFSVIALGIFLIVEYSKRFLIFYHR